MGKIIEVKNLTKIYPDKNSSVSALDDVSFSLEEGKSLAIVGPSGSGKSTLLQILGALDKPTLGEIIINGKNIASADDKFLSEFRNSTIGFIFQFFHLQEYMSIKENVEIPTLFGKSNSKASELLKKVGLENRANHYPSQISGGEMQRASIARALINNPKIILADEPTGNLDRENTQKVLQIFKQIQNDGVSVIVITHDEELAKNFDFILRLNKGKLLEFKEN